MPPIEFQELVDSLVPEGPLKSAIQELLTRKKAGDEMDYEPRINPINEFLEARIAYYDRTASTMQVGEGGQDRQLDELFRSALKEVWG
ncbi:putative nucleotidyltransferase [compost metagenome]